MVVDLVTAAASVRNTFAGVPTPITAGALNTRFCDHATVDDVEAGAALEGDLKHVSQFSRALKLCATYGSWSGHGDGSREDSDEYRKLHGGRVELLKMG